MLTFCESSVAFVPRVIGQEPTLQQRAAFILAVQQLHAAIAGVLLHLLSGEFFGAELAVDFAFGTSGGEMIFHADARNSGGTIGRTQNRVPFAHVQVSLVEKWHIVIRGRWGRINTYAKKLVF